MENFNIAGALNEIAAKYPEKPGLIHGLEKFTFAELNGFADTYAQLLSESGIEPGDRTVLMVRPSIDFICLTFALFRIGAPVILIDPGMGYRNLLRCIGSVEPDALIGIPAAHIFRMLFADPFKTVKKKVCVGPSFGILGKSLKRPTSFGQKFQAVESGEKDLAAIIFTTGSTGPPKGVRYEHGVFQAQLRLIRDYYGITPDDIDQPAFPLFALFSAALGACSVIPDMNPAHPARVDPRKFVASIMKHGVTYSFGSPAIWNVVSRYCLDNSIRLSTVRKILMAGAPVSGELIERTKKILAADGEIHTPYGATESLPIASNTGSEILGRTWPLSRRGKGTCVGKPLPGIKIRIIPISEEQVDKFSDSLPLPEGEVGEIIVKGGVVTREYENNDRENRLGKIPDSGGFWHRMGDVGYFDNEGRLWFCGRKAHRVETSTGSMFTIPCEAIFNEHPDVFRSALVGLGTAGEMEPVIIVEPSAKIQDKEALFKELGRMAQEFDHTKMIRRFLIHPSFPVDIRHNAKIFREKLAVWAQAEFRRRNV